MIDLIRPAQPIAALAMTIFATALAIFLTIFGHLTASADTPRVDQVAYFRALQLRRPDLVGVPCKDNLLAKPEYRSEILGGRQSYASIVGHKYTADLVAEDKKWADKFRATSSILKAQIDRTLIDRGVPADELNSYRAWQIRYSLPYYVANYPPEFFVGLGVGDPGVPDAHGLKPKVFLQLRAVNDRPAPNRQADFSPFHSRGVSRFATVSPGPDDPPTNENLDSPQDLLGYAPTADTRLAPAPRAHTNLDSALTPKSYLDFTMALSKAGFRGDSKVQLGAGRMRFQFNNIVVHAATVQDAVIAEQVATRFFGARLQAIGRGFDVRRTDGSVPAGWDDWHQFLCSDQVGTLPDYAWDFLKGP